MTLEQASKKVKDLQNKIGDNIPNWNTPIKAIIVAPTGVNTIDFLLRVIQSNQPITIAREYNADNYDALMIFTGQNGVIAYEWYDAIYPD